MKLSILIVNWNTRDQLVKCLNSILENPPSFDYEIIVVDNHSQDGSLNTLTHLFGHNKRVKIIPSLRNLGYAKANNLAFTHSSGEYIFVLNPDTEVGPNALQSLVDYFADHPGLGGLGPKLLNPDGSLQHSVRRFPTIWSSVLVFSGLHRFFRPHKYLMDGFSYQEIQEVDQLMGAAFLTSRKIIEQLGFLDEKFWLWYEEVDFCRRLKNAGYQVKFYPYATVTHRGGESFVQMPVYERKKTVARSLIHYFRKNGSFLQVLAINLLLPLVLLLAKFLDFVLKSFNVKWKPHT